MEPRPVQRGPGVVFPESRRGDAWRAAGLGPFATVEAVGAAGFDEARRPARPATGEIGPSLRAA